MFFGSQAASQAVHRVSTEHVADLSVGKRRLRTSASKQRDDEDGK